MFEPTGLGKVIFEDRYRLGEEDWGGACTRVANHIAAAEENGKRDIFTKRFFSELSENYFMPGGRIWYGCGRPKAQLLNCLRFSTLVHTRDGLEKAGDLEGRTVDVLSDDGIYRSSEWFCYGEQELYEITFETGDTVFTTAQHGWWIPSGGRGRYRRVETRHLSGECVPVQGIANFEYDENDWFFGVRHGLIYGDGNLYLNGKFSCLNQFGDSLHLVSDFWDETEIVQYNDWHWHVNKQPSTYKSLPLPSQSRSYIRGFIAGLIAADGHISRAGGAVLHSRDEDALNQIRYLASYAGIPTYAPRLARLKSPFDGSDKPLYRMGFGKSAFWNDGGLDRYMVLKQRHVSNALQGTRPRNRGFQKVVSVRPTGAWEKVYCCTEPETHSFVIEHGLLTANCFVVPTADSREGWGTTTHDVIVISGLMGGVGINVSPVRPRGSVIRGTGGVATGAVSLMSLINDVGNVIVGGGGRRMALMLCLDITHPDLEEFLAAKLDLQRLNNANISVVLPPGLSGKDFKSLVEEDGDIPLSFNGIPSGKTLKAREVWNRIVENSWKSGEPGVLNGDLANRMSNLHYYKPLIATNPCGEIWLEEYGCCCLGALVLPSFVRNGEFDWDKLDESVRLGVRFLDDVLTVNHYPLPEIEENCKNVRRIGLGALGLHTMLLELGMDYNSKESFEFVDSLYGFIKNTSYDASVNLAIEKGPFPKYDPKFLDSGFAKTLKRGIRNKIREHGIRNCALLTIAPTGTTSMVCERPDMTVSSGIEPLPPAVYWRTYFKPNDKGERELTKELVVDGAFWKYPKVQSALDIPVEDHFRMQAIVQSHIDNAVSKTINMPKDYPMDKFGDIWLEYLDKCKGTTVYRYGSRENEPISPVPREEWPALLKEHNITPPESNPATDDLQVNELLALACPSGVCDLK